MSEPLSKGASSSVSLTEIRASQGPWQMAKEGPLRPLAEGGWAVFGYHAAHRVLTDGDFGHHPHQEEWLAEQRDLSFPRQVRNSMLLNLDPPTHTSIRALIYPWLSKQRVSQFQSRIHDHLSDLLEQITTSDRFDALNDFAYPLASRVIADILGIPWTDAELFVKWAKKIARSADPLPTSMIVDEADEAANDFVDYITPHLEARRDGQGLLGTLVRAHHQGEILNETDLLGTVLVLIFAGHETTAHLIGNSVASLLEGPSLMDMVRDRQVTSRLMEELLRLQGPVQLVRRRALKDTSVLGVDIREGERLLVFLGAANRDESIFRSPQKSNLTRQTPHLALGAGAHFCLGSHLARLEVTAALSALLPFLSGFEIDSAKTPEWRQTLTLRGLTALPLERAT